MQITAATTFKHGTVQYAEGVDYDVDLLLAGYFLGNGWAVRADGDGTLEGGTPSDVTLDVASSTIGHQAGEV